MAVKSPKYDLIKKEKNFEIRKYGDMILAETPTDNDFTSNGFYNLFNYITGSNSKREKISMTAPVIHHKSENGNYSMAFVMPEEKKLESLPSPSNKQVELHKLPEKTYASIKFSGYFTKQKATNKTNELINWIKKNKYKASGDPLFARYNSPFSIPAFRRNEILIEININSEN